jgi:NDP-sugar pyrophosphorylase family protein
MQAIILCGGKGTRLSSLYSGRPKIMVPVANRPFLEWQLEWLGRQGISDIHLAAGYKAEVLQGWLEAEGQKSDSSAPLPSPASPSPHFTLHVSHFTFHVSLSTEPLPLGTGGGLKFIAPWLRSDPFLVINGDSLIPNLNFKELEESHRQSGRQSTITVTRIEGTGRYGTVEFDHSGCITAFREKADRTEGWVNAGVYVATKQVLQEIPNDKTVSIETDTFPALVQQARLNAYQCPPPLLDMGTPEGIKAIEPFLTCGLPSKGEIL